MYSSGYGFNDEGYQDWIYSGDKFNKDYDTIIEASDYSDEQLYEILDAAQAIEFSDVFEPSCAFVKLNDKVSSIKIPHLKERIDTSCDTSGYSKGLYEEIYWYKTCLEGYQKKHNDKLVFLTKESGRFKDWNNVYNLIRLKNFKRSYYYLEEGIWGQVFRFTLGWLLKKYTDLPGRLPESYWYGEGYFQLNVGSESLNFIALVSKQGEQINFENITHYHWPDNLKDELYLFSIDCLSNYEYQHKMKLTSLYKDDVGLYVVRKKKLYDLHNSFDQDYQWKLKFTGTSSDNNPWADIKFLGNSTGNAHVLSSDSAVPEYLQGIPEEISIYLPKASKGISAFQLFYDDKEIWLPVNSGDKGVHFALKFNVIQMEGIFRQLKKFPSYTYLKIDFERLTKTSVHLRIKLLTQTKELSVSNISVSNILQFHSDQKQRQSVFEKGMLTALYVRVRDKEESVNCFIALSKQVVTSTENPKELAFTCANYTTKLMLMALDENRFKDMENLVLNYSNVLLPLTGKHEKSSDVASLALVLALAAKKPGMKELIFERLLGEEFDIEAETNEILLYNLACYYASVQNTSAMFQSIKLALKQGKKPEQFLLDKDFESYWNDDDFLYLLKTFE